MIYQSYSMLFIQNAFGIGVFGTWSKRDSAAAIGQANDWVVRTADDFFSNTDPLFTFYGDIRISEAADGDGDGVLDVIDNCVNVANAGQLDGIISVGDLVKAVIADQQFTIKMLEDYIWGR